MSYIKNNLNTNEEIIYEGELHWIVFIAPIITSILMLSFICYVLSFVMSNNFIFGAYIGLFIISILYGFIDKFTTEIIITNKRVMKKVGLFERNVQELNIAKIETIDLYQSIFGRIFNYGTLTFIGTGSSSFNILGIINPNEFKNQLNDVIQNKNEAK